MDCIVTAGGRPDPQDALYIYTQGKQKAVLDMDGRTMLERVIDALQGSENIDRIVIIGLEDDQEMQFKKPIDMYLPDQGSFVGNVFAGINWLRSKNTDSSHVLFCTSDVPSMTTATLDSFISTCQPLDKAVYYIFVTKEAMEARFPLSNRTYVKLRGVEIAGGDIAIAQMDLADSHRELWQALTDARKHAWKLAQIVGIGWLLKFLLRRVSIEDIEIRAEKIIERPVQIVVNPPAELAMDVDKPEQYEMLQADLINSRKNN